MERNVIILQKKNSIAEYSHWKDLQNDIHKVKIGRYVDLQQNKKPSTFS